MLKREKGWSKQEARGSPKFKDIEIGNGSLQVIVRPPHTVVKDGASILKEKDWAYNWRVLLEHPDTSVKITLR